LLKLLLDVGIVLIRKNLTAAVRSYCNSVRYLKVSKEGASQFDLAGEPAGTVTEVEAESAREEPVHSSWLGPS
jgi:sRNA-binding protein